MEPLFEVKLNYAGQNINYAVHFEEETYVFRSQNSDAPEIRLRREDDEWHELTGVDNGLKSDAVTELDRYLLAQH